MTTKATAIQTTDTAETENSMVSTAKDMVSENKSLTIFNEKLEDIQESLKSSGLITQSDIDAHNAKTIANMGSNNKDSINVVANNSGSAAGISHGKSIRMSKRDKRQERINQARNSFSRKITKTVSPPTPIDPQDVPDEHGYTPRMKGLMDDPGFSVLLDILSQKRPKGSVSEAIIIDKYIRNIEGIQEDKCGNFVLDLGENPHGVLWSCHTDTVHSGRESGRQRVVITTRGNLALSQTEQSSCLGADDGTGMWIMLEMIKGNVPGRYVFHYGEESGCIGSGFIKDNRPEVLEGMRFAIAFDRAGTSDVITHQRSRRCCSDNFALSIAKQLPGDYAPARGVYTDTAEYMGVIPECTNLSVGYQSQHSNRETQNLPHLYRLRDAMLKIDPSQFVCERDPKAQEVSTFRAGAHSAYDGIYGHRGSYYGHGREDYDARFNRFFKKEDEAAEARRYEGTEESEEIQRVFGKSRYDDIPFDDHEEYGHESDYSDTKYRSQSNRTASFQTQGHRLVKDAKRSRLQDQFSPNSPPRPHDLRELIQRYPNELADCLESMGFDVHEFWEDILSGMGYRMQ